MKPRIGILTAFTGSDPAYSLVNVVRVQLQMLLDAGYNPVLFAAPTFTGTGVFDPSHTEIRKVAMPDDPADTIAAALAPQLSDIDILFCHDIVFLGQHRLWAEAICKVAEDYPNIAWVHWQHSRGDGRTHAHPERSWFAYPNKGDLQHCADINCTDLEHVAYIPHPLDFDYLGWPGLAVQIAEDHDYHLADVAGILPARLDRQKQVDKAIRIYAGLKRAGKSVSFLIADAFATGERFIKYKRECEKIARLQGLDEYEFCFLGEKYEECTYSTPRQVVKALLEMGNLFIQPSNSETSSLVVMEAALAGNLLVINADFPPIHHLYGQALTLPFGSVIQDKPTEYFRHVKLANGTTAKIPDPQQYWDDEARNTILPVLDSQVALDVKRQQLRDRWPSTVFSEHIQPLIDRVYQPKPIEIQSGDPEVTAIITTLDNLPLLEKQIEILSDEAGHIIVVNNGSQDGTAEWLMSHPIHNLSYVNRENRGAGPGRNEGLRMWDLAPTPYTLMIDGGILPPRGGVAECKRYLHAHPEAHVVSPEVASCFTTEESEATLIAPALHVDEHICFHQRCLSSTAYCLCKAEAWAVRFSEEGPYGEPGWGVDDNDMAYRWNEAGILHHEFTHDSSGWMLYRRASGSFKRIFEETGIHANQYGSVYEKRAVKCYQDWRPVHAGTIGHSGIPTAAYIIDGVKMPDFARLVKKLHNDDLNCEIVVMDDYDPEVTRWLDTFSLRWQWGNCTVDPDGKILWRGVDYPEELWSGNVVRNRAPLIDALVITPENVGQFLSPQAHENAFFKRTDPKATEIEGYPIPPEWWSRVYEYPWALQYAGEGMTVADMGCGWQFRPFKDALAARCAHVYAVDQHWEIRNQEPHDNMLFVVADFSQRINAIPEGSLDRVFCISVLEELPALTGALSEFARLLKPGGLCVLTCDVQYDLERPLTDFGAVKIEDLMQAIEAAGLEFTLPNFDKDNAVKNENFNLCVFHIVARKP